MSTEPPIICVRCQAMPTEPGDYLCDGCRDVLTVRPPSFGETVDYFLATVRAEAQRDLRRLARFVGLRR